MRESTVGNKDDRMSLRDLRDGSERFWQAFEEGGKEDCVLNDSQVFQIGGQ